VRDNLPAKDGRRAMFQTPLLGIACRPEIRLVSFRRQIRVGVWQKTAGRWFGIYDIGYAIYDIQFMIFGLTLVSSGRRAMGIRI